MSLKPTLPKGTRDILPQAMLGREYILDTIRSVFKRFGFSPIETPAMENASTLSGKYGEEGDRLIFKILPRGEKGKLDGGKIVPKEALRYDLTVPFARFVVQNQNDLQFPFKRYQIQPVWRADKPQRGRYREFYQCDADAIGSDSLLLELDFLKIYEEVFSKLNLGITIKINNRKLLAGFAESLGITDRLGEFTISLDKLDKIGIDGVANEMRERNFSEDVIDGLRTIASLSGSNEEKLQLIESKIGNTEIGKKGVEELSFVFNTIPDSAPVELDVTLARGLDYYTGAIFEVVSNEVELGSIGGGGRYDDLTGIFGLKDMSGIGISFGLDRIQLVLEELNKVPEFNTQGTQIIFFNFGEDLALYSLGLVNRLREAGVNAEVYPDSAKFKKQVSYAEKRKIPYMVSIESLPTDEGQITVKNVATREREELSIEQLITKLKH